jgi:hypothetical protein
MKPSVPLFLLCALLSACGDSEAPSSSGHSDGDDANEVQLGPYGPPLGARAHVVNSLKVKLSGAVNATFTGDSADGITGLEGLCNPKTFANFLLAAPGGKDYDEVWVSNMSTRAVGTGATGDFRLDYVEVTLRKLSGEFIQRDFRGPATLTLTSHDARPGHRHMVGTMNGQGLHERGGDSDQTVDLTVEFDMNSSCGVQD